MPFWYIFCPPCHPPKTQLTNSVPVFAGHFVHGHTLIIVFIPADGIQQTIPLSGLSLLQIQSLVLLFLLLTFLITWHSTTLNCSQMRELLSWSILQ